MPVELPMDHPGHARRMAGASQRSQHASKSAWRGSAKVGKVRDLGRLPRVMRAERSWT